MLYPDFNDLIALKNWKAKLPSLSRHLARSITPGGRHSPFRGRGLEFDAVREYVPGDDIRSIDWRVTARSGRPHLKVFREDRERQVLLCVDMNSQMRFGTRNTFKSIQAAQMAAFLGWQAIVCHECVGGYLFGDVQDSIRFFPPKRTRSSFLSMLHLMSSPPINHSKIPLENILAKLAQTTPSGTLIYIISDFSNIDTPPLLESQLAHLCKKNDLVLIAIHDRADRELPAIGPLCLLGAHHQKTIIDTNHSAGRERYTLQWEEDRAYLRTLCHRFKIPFIELSTESLLPQELILALKSMVRRSRR